MQNQSQVQKFGLKINTYYIHDDTILKIGQGIFCSYHPHEKQSSVIRKTEVTKINTPLKHNKTETDTQSPL